MILSHHEDIGMSLQQSLQSSVALLQRSRKAVIVCPVMHETPQASHRHSASVVKDGDEECEQLLLRDGRCLELTSVRKVGQDLR
jgi:hypothetical protein